MTAVVTQPRELCNEAGVGFVVGIHGVAGVVL